MKKSLISVIVPVYNAERFISETINTVLKQSYTNFELILVDDNSQDESEKIIRKFMLSDERIVYHKLDKNCGAAIARNTGIELAHGEFICFLDADDLWDENKLKIQYEFMKQNNYAFSYSSYEFANENGIPNGKKVIVPKKINYKMALRNTTIWTCTVMFNMNILNKDTIKMPNVKSEDTACWWKVLKTIDYAYGIENVLSYYRRSAGTLSSNKLVAVKRIWNLYRNVEKCSLIKSIYYFSHYAVNAVKRRV